MAVMVNTAYTSDRGGVHPIRMRPDTAAAVGSAGAGVTITNPIRVKISKSKRQAGIRCRGLNIARVVTSGTVSIVEYAFLPILTPTAFADFAENDTLSYKGTTWRVAGLVSEDIN